MRYLVHFYKQSLHKVYDCYNILENENRYKLDTNKITFWDKLQRIIDETHKEKTCKK